MACLAVPVRSGCDMMSSADKSRPHKLQATAIVLLTVLLCPAAAAAIRFLPAVQLVTLSLIVAIVLLMPSMRGKIATWFSRGAVPDSWRWGSLLVGAAAVPLVLGG